MDNKKEEYQYIAIKKELLKKLKLTMKAYNLDISNNAQAIRYLILKFLDEHKLIIEEEEE